MMLIDISLVKDGDILAEGVACIPKYTVITEELKVKLLSLSCGRVKIVSLREVHNLLVDSTFLRVQLAHYLLSYSSVLSLSDFTERNNAVIKVYNVLLSDINLIELLYRMRNGNKQLLSHSLNVGIYSALFTDDSEVVRGCLYHDIGKLSIPYYILNKKGILDDDEFAIITKHTKLRVSFLPQSMGSIAKDIILHHHERLDGSGYPDGITDIAQSTQICTVCDMYDALISRRCYKGAMSVSDAFSVLFEECKSGKLDIKIVEKLKGKVMLFSIGSLVSLKSGEIGVIVSRLADGSFSVCTEYGKYLNDLQETSMKTII